MAWTYTVHITVYVCRSDMYSHCSAYHKLKWYALPMVKKRINDDERCLWLQRTTTKKKLNQKVKVTLVDFVTLYRIRFDLQANRTIQWRNCMVYISYLFVLNAFFTRTPQRRKLNWLQFTLGSIPLEPSIVGNHHHQLDYLDKWPNERIVK